jgi:hypothetical protein
MVGSFSHKGAGGRQFWLPLAGLCLVAMTGTGWGQSQDLTKQGAEASEAKSPDMMQHTFIYQSAIKLNSVAVAGSFNNWGKNANLLVPDAEGKTWRTTLDLPPGKHLYKFVLNGETWVADPKAPAEGAYGNSVLLLGSASDRQQVVTKPCGVTGVVKRHEKFRSAFVEARNIDVWLPPGYTQSKSKRFPVIYMHDGQNLFDPKLAFAGVDWGIDETMSRLIKERKTREAIVVGIWNTAHRLAEYMPQKAVVRVLS